MRGVGAALAAASAEAAAAEDEEEDPPPLAAAAEGEAPNAYSAAAGEFGSGVDAAACDALRSSSSPSAPSYRAGELITVPAPVLSAAPLLPPLPLVPRLATSRGCFKLLLLEALEMLGREPMVALMSPLWQTRRRG